jgi:hypothetical protein
MDGYLLLGRIGEGAHGVVFQGASRSTGALVAIKKIAANAARALREIEALKVRRPRTRNKQCYYLDLLGGFIRKMPRLLPLEKRVYR